MKKISKRLFLTLLFLSPHCFSSELLRFFPPEVLIHIFFSPNFYPEDDEFLRHVLKTRLLFKAPLQVNYPSELYRSNLLELSQVSGKCVKDCLKELCRRMLTIMSQYLSEDIKVALLDMPYLVKTVFSEVLEEGEYVLNLLNMIGRKIDLIQIFNDFFTCINIVLEYERENKLFTVTREKQQPFRCIWVNLDKLYTADSFQVENMEHIDALLVIPGIYPDGFYFGYLFNKTKVQKLLTICGILEKKNPFIFETMSHVMIVGEPGFDSLEYIAVDGGNIEQTQHIQTKLKQFNDTYITKMQSDVKVIFTSAMFEKMVRENKIFGEKNIVKNPYSHTLDFDSFDGMTKMSRKD